MYRDNSTVGASLRAKIIREQARSHLATVFATPAAADFRRYILARHALAEQ